MVGKVFLPTSVPVVGEDTSSSIDCPPQGSKKPTMSTEREVGHASLHNSHMHHIHSMHVRLSLGKLHS